MLDFVVIGFQKCGTVSARKLLLDHPEVAVPPVELAPFRVSAPWGSGPSADEFAQTIAGQDGLVGTVDPTYAMCDVSANAASLATHSPDATLIAFERDPVERAFSAWSMASAAGWDGRSFEEAVIECMESDPCWTKADWLRQSYVEAGEYDRICAAFGTVVRLRMGDGDGLCRALGIQSRKMPHEHRTHYPSMMCDPEVIQRLRDHYESS